jgi:hypothetical protein
VTENLRPGREVLREAWALAAILLLFAALSLYRWRSPGLVPDALQDEVRASRLLERWREHGVAGSLSLPYGRVKLYHGQILSYPLAAVFAVFGEGWRVVRSVPVAWGLVVLAMSYAFLRGAFGRAPALFGTALLAMDPSFQTVTRTGMSVSSHMAAFSVGALLLLRRCWRTRSPVDAFAAGVVLGLGLSTRVHFGWFLGALLVAGAAYRGAVRVRAGDRAGALLSAALLGALLSAAPLLWGEWKFGFRGVDRAATLAAPLASPSGPVGYVSNLAGVVRKADFMLSGRSAFASLFGERASLPSPGALAFWGGGLFLAASLRRERVWPARRWAGLCLLVPAVMLLETALAPSAKVTRIHLAFLHPFPAFVAAGALAAALRRVRGRPSWRLAPWGAAAVFLAWQATGAAAYAVRLGGEGATGTFNDAVYSVADWVSTERRPGLVVCPDEHVFRTLYFLCPGERDRLRLPPRRALPELPRPFDPALDSVRPGIHLLLWPPLPAGQPGVPSHETVARRVLGSAGRVMPGRRFYDGRGGFRAEALYVEAPDE